VKWIRAFVIIPALMVVLPAQEAPVKMTDAQIEAFARQAVTLQDPAGQKAALEKLRGYHFRTSRIKEREFTLYAQGLLEDRLGETQKAAATLRKLEITWPQSPYLLEVQTILAFQSIERRRFKDAEARLRKAMDSDIPVESKRRTQELLLWTLAEQGRQAEGLPIVKSLHPLGASKPSERGLVAILETLCLANEKEQAEATRKDLQALYPSGRYTSRANLAWARLLGTTGDAPGAAEILRTIITSDKDTPEADEARLALASLLSEGKLHPKEAEMYPAPQKLLAEIHRNDRQGNAARKALLVELRIDMSQARWKQALDTANKLMEDSSSPEERAKTGALRADALKSWAQQCLDQKSVDPLLPYLDNVGINALSPEQRLNLIRLLAQSGLPDAAKTTAELAPQGERATLMKVVMEATLPEANPEETLKMLPAKGDSPAQALRRAQSLIALKRWKEVNLALGKATPGPERISALLTYLQRPPDKQESPLSRQREAESWLARLPEKGPDREPIAILVADLRAKGGDWHNALALYPVEPQKGNRGWTALMRATCQLKLGQKEAARTTLKTAVDEPDFKMERQTLGKQLGM
jgi:tetratricopeptide (TPR) repeat protein